MVEHTFRGIGMTSERTRRRMVAQLSQQGIQSPLVLTAISAVPRHIFVEEAIAHRAYENDALPIGEGQTISQPYIVALMTELLLGNGLIGRILEVGTGCGYQTSVLAQLWQHVYTLERISVLQIKARQRLLELGLVNVDYRCADGFRGWAEQAPYDAIMVTAAALSVPEHLFAQLVEGGCMVLPIGAPDGVQALTLVTKVAGEAVEKDLAQVRFVPMVPGIQR